MLLLLVFPVLAALSFVIWVSHNRRNTIAVGTLSCSLTIAVIVFLIGAGVSGIISGKVPKKDTDIISQNEYRVEFIGEGKMFADIDKAVAVSNIDKIIIDNVERPKVIEVKYRNRLSWLYVDVDSVRHWFICPQGNQEIENE